MIPAYFGATPAQSALSLIEEGYELVSDSLVAEAYRACVRAGLLAMMGLAEESRRESRRALHVWDEVATPRQRYPTYEILGQSERFLGRSDTAERIYDEAIAQLSASGESAFNSTLLGLRALALCDLGRFQEANEDARRSRDLGAEDDWATQMAWRTALARIESHRGENDAALALTEDAIDIGARTDDIVERGEANEVKGTIFTAMGRPDKAKEAFEASLSLFERKGVVPWASRVRSRLAEF